jgi:hypothetical protein
MIQENSSTLNTEIWEMIGLLLRGQIPLCMIREKLFPFEAGEYFITNHLTPTGQSVNRLPCHDCDETCDNEKWIKKLSDGNVIKVCPLHPLKCEDITADDVSFYCTSQNFYRTLAKTMNLQDIPEAFSANNLIYIGNWNTSNFFGAIYICNAENPKLLEATIDKLISEKLNRDAEEKFAVIVPCLNILLDGTLQKLRTDRSKCVEFKEIFDISSSGEIVFKDSASDLFSVVDMTRLVNQRVKFIERKEINGKTFWYINGQLSAFKRGISSDHFKVIALLEQHYNQGGSWVSHEALITELNWTPDKYWGSQENNYSRQGSKVISVLRSELGIEIEFSKQNGYRITGNLSIPKTVPK